MAYRAYQPSKPNFRKVKKLRGRNLDNVTRDMMSSYNHNPWESIYVKEICDPSNLGSQPRQGPLIATHGKKGGHQTILEKRSKKRRDSRNPNGAKGTFENLNDNVSVRSFQTRNKGGKRGSRGSRQQQPDQEYDNMFNGNRPKQNNFASSSLLKKAGGAAVSRGVQPPKGENYEDQLAKGPQNPYFEGQLPIDDSEFYREGWENGRPQPETLVEKNIMQLLVENPEFRSKCLRAGYPIQKKSVYKKDYIPMNSEVDPALNPKLSFKPDQKMDLSTIHKTDYVPPAKFNVVEPQPGDRAKRRGLDDGAEHLKAPINRHTNYQLDYPDWGAIPQTGLLQPTNPKTLASGMPFYERQTYKDYGNFKVQPKPRKFNPEKGAKNPLGVDLPFIGDTCYGSFYRPFKVGPGAKGPELEKVKEKMPTYAGQYKTIYQDYDGRGNKPSDNKKKPCCIVTPDQKVCMINETTKSIIENASPELSQAILGDLVKSAKQMGRVDGQMIYDATEYLPPQ